MKAVGIILAGGSNKKLKTLNEKRATPALPIGGSYRAIDFALSSMTNSRIKTVAVLAQYNQRSLIHHLNSSKWWDFGRKQGGLYVFSPTITPSNSQWYRGTADSIAQNIDFLKSQHEPYVVITSGDCVYKIDFDKLIDYHSNKNADITIVTKAMPEGKDLTQFGIVTVDEDNNITDIEEKPMSPATNIVSCGIYVMRRRLLIDLIEKAVEEDRYDFVNDILIRYKGVKKYASYPIDSYWAKIADVQTYYDINMDFLKPENRKFFFKDYPEVYTKIDDNPPAKFNPGAKVKNSLISSGSIINGEVEGSVLFKKVFVGNNCVIKNCVLMNDVYVSDNVTLENVIVESGSTIKANETIKADKPVVVVEENERFML